MKKISKVLALIMAAAMVLSLAACGSSSSGSTAAASSKSEAPAAEAKSEAAPAAEASSEAAPAADSDDHSDWIHYDWKFATWLTETNPFQENIDRLQYNLDKYCDGTIKITTYPSGTLVGMNDMLDALDAGTAEMVYVELDLFPNNFPISQVMNYPGINYNSALVATKVWREFQETYPMDEFDGYKVWMWQSSGPSCLFTTEPINSMADMQGKQLGAVGTVNAEILEAWGATPVTVETSEMYEAIRNGLIGGRIGMFGACAMTNLDEIAKNAVVFPMGSYSFVGLIKQELYDAMPASQQEAFDKAIDATFNEVTIYYQDAGLAGNPRVAECVANVDFKLAEGELLQGMTDGCMPMLQNYCAKLTEQGYDGDGIYAKLQELADKYNTEMTWEDYASCYFDANFFEGQYPPAD